MSIHDWTSKIKSYTEESPGKVHAFYTLILLVIVASIFFALGRLAALEEKHSPLTISKSVTPQDTRSQTSAAIEAFIPTSETASTTLQTSTETAQNGEVIGSKSGKKYYYPWCGTLKRVKLQNQIHFGSIDLARAAGYVPAANCKGLK